MFILAFALESFLEGTDSRAEFACYFTNPSHSEEQDEDAEDDEKFGGPKSKHD